MAYFPRGRSKPDRFQRQTRRILQTRTHFRALARRSFVNAFRVGPNDPDVSSVLAGLVHDVGIVGRIAQHDHAGVFGQRRAANQIGGRFGSGSIFELLLGTVFFGVVRDLPWMRYPDGVISKPKVKLWHPFGSVDLLC